MGTETTKAVDGTGEGDLVPDFDFGPDSAPEPSALGDWTDIDFTEPAESADPVIETPATPAPPAQIAESPAAELPIAEAAPEVQPGPPAAVAKAAPKRALAATPAPETGRLDRLSDFRSPYAAAYLEVLEAQEAVEAARLQVIEAEGRIGERLVTLLTRSEQLLERAERIESSVTLASDLLGQQARLIAKAFREQLTAPELDGVATLKTHLLEVADEVANRATVALNQVADEAAAFSGVKAEAAALQRVTSVVIEQAKQAGLEQPVLALANIVGRLQLAAERLEQAPAPAPAPQPQDEAQQWAPQGLGAHRMVTMWIGHHLGTPGLLVALAGIGLLAWRFVG